MSLRQKLKKSQRDKWYLRLITDHPDGDGYDGIVVHFASDFVGFREVRDFDLDGLIVLPKKHLAGHRDGRVERCGNAIMQMCRAQTLLRVPRWLPSCDSLPKLIAKLHARDIWPAVEVLFDKGRRSATYLGMIQRVEDTGFVIKGYSASGTWEKPTHIGFDEVFRLEFDSRYCNQFNAYMQQE